MLQNNALLCHYFTLILLHSVVNSLKVQFVDKDDSDCRWLTNQSEVGMQKCITLDISYLFQSFLCIQVSFLAQFS